MTTRTYHPQQQAEGQRHPAEALTHYQDMPAALERILERLRASGDKPDAADIEVLAAIGRSAQVLAVELSRCYEAQAHD